MLGTLARSEHCELRLHGELLVRLAPHRKVSADEILGLEKSPPTRDGRLLRRLQDLDTLSKRDRGAFMRMLDAFPSKPQPGQRPSLLPCSSERSCAA